MRKDLQACEGCNTRRDVMSRALFVGAQPKRRIWHDVF